MSKTRRTFAALFAFVNLLTDILYAIVDPSVRGRLTARGGRLA